MTNNNIECPVDFVLMNERKARLNAGMVLILALLFLITKQWLIPVLLIPDFFIRGFNFGRYSYLGFISDRLIHIFAIPPKLTDQAPKRFAAKTGLLFCILIVTCFALNYITLSLIIAWVLVVFAFLESVVGFCAGCYVYSFYIKFLKKKKLLFTGCLLFACFSFCQTSKAQPAKNDPSFTIENYYRVKWGFAEEFIHLWMVNHYPLLKKAMQKGDIISVSAESPKLHSGEDTRWDFKVTIVFKDSDKAFDANLTEPYKKLIYPDTDKLKKDEQHRFELLISHWDVMVEKVGLE